MHCQIYCGYFLLVSDLPSICVNLLMTNVFNVDVQLLLCSKNLCLFQGHKHFIMFFSRTFRVSDFIFNSMIHLKSVLHMVWGKNRFFFFFFPTWIFSCSAHLTERLSFLPLNCFGIFVKHQLIVLMWVLSGVFILFYLLLC